MPIQKITAFVKSESVLVISGVLALISCFFTLPSAAYFSYINYKTLAILFCLMTVVAGLRAIGIFEILCHFLLSRVRSVRWLMLVMVLLCFFLSMFLTNDVALITLVPFTLTLMESEKSSGNSERMLIHVLVMETISANLGSMLTPFGNPQNLYLYTAYNFSMGEFIKLMLPYSFISLILVIAGTLCFPLGKINASSKSDFASEISLSENRGRLIVYVGLFFLSILSVSRILDYRLVLILVIVAVLICDRRRFLNVDYSLLLIFVFFFIFIGNIGAITQVDSFLSSVIRGREVLVSILTSQVTSNVPAAILLSDFTENGKGLVIGTNLGGLGTLIASMASLITYRFYAQRKNAKNGRYLVYFSLLNAAFLVILYLFYIFIRLY